MSTSQTKEKKKPRPNFEKVMKILESASVAAETRAIVDHYLNSAYNEGWYDGYGEGYEDCREALRGILSSSGPVR